MAGALLDTTFFVDLRRGDAGAVTVWESISSGRLTASYSAVSAFELWLGNQPQAEEDFYQAAFFVLEEVPLTASAARLAGSWLRQLPGAAAERLIRDALIAASAFERNEAVCTRNRRDFSRFAIEVQSY